MPGHSNFGIRKTSAKAQAMRNRWKERAETRDFCMAIVNEVVDEALGQNYNFPSVIDENVYNGIMNHELCVEVETTKSNVIEGSRIIKSMNYFMNRLITLQFDHSKSCKGKILFQMEQRLGLASTFMFQCDICHYQCKVATEDPTKKPVINKEIVWATLATGSCYSHTLEFLSALDIPGQTKTMFYKTQRELSKVYKDSLWDEMELAGKEEHAIAVQCGDVDADGVPFITVCLDGGWSKRSYGHSYDAFSGVAVIIGRKTGKVLFVGIRNKFCIVCTKAASRGSQCENHICFKNFTGSSGSMETSIIIEGFNISIKMHNLRYKRFIGDGDSSVFTNIKEKVVYGQEVEKIECVNHCIKNYSKRLYQIKGNTKAVSLATRKFLTTQTIAQLTRIAQKAIYKNHKSGDNNVMRLKEDLRNSVKCVFGHHEQCRSDICKTPGNVANSKYENLQVSGAYHHIYSALNNLIVKAPQLILNETNNKSEAFMNVLARFNMGKRLNLVQRDSFQIRAHLTALRYNQGHSWHTNVWNKYYKRSPGKIMKKYMASATESEWKKKLRVKPRCLKKLKFNSKPEEVPDYGRNIAEINLSPEELEIEKRKLLANLQVTESKRSELAEATKGQFENPVYVDARLNRLTASHFGAVIKRRPTTPCHSLVKTILKSDSTVFSPAIEYGKMNETVAISKFQEKTGKSVKKSGLYVYLRYGFLGASPDGIINEHEIVEVKCLHKVATLGISLKEAVVQKKVPCLEMYESEIRLSRNHNYFYQIQGQLAITEATVCHFICYSGDQNDLYIENIHFDQELWHSKMLPKLTTFYMDCLAPNIIEERPSKGRCKDPQSITQAIEIRNQKKKSEEAKKIKKRLREND